jgi:hypothetical protein
MYNNAGKHRQNAARQTTCRECRDLSQHTQPPDALANPFAMLPGLLTKPSQPNRPGHANEKRVPLLRGRVNERLQICTGVNDPIAADEKGKGGVSRSTLQTAAV